MPRPTPHLWQKAPFVRLIIPLIAGILIQFVWPVTPLILSATGGVLVVISFVFLLLPLTYKYVFRWATGIVINLLLIITGAFLVYNQSIRHQNNWIGNYNTDSAAILATVQEPLVEKAKTFKAEASIDAVNVDGDWKVASGKMLIYFSKEGLQKMQYGSQVIIYKPLQLIKNAGNPGGFNYKQYNAFQNVFHQVFLKSNEYKVSSYLNGSVFKNWLFNVRNTVIQKIQQNIKPAREAGVAEALLIGYRDDLDKTLVQAYSNTGVVHIIAISGMHLGMIYLALVWLMKPIKKTRWTRLIKAIIILAVLWTFTMLAGAVPSILRSAVMFSFIVLADALDRRSNIYNMLAVSAFAMLYINPFYLWDVGFQLSYAAVIGIIALSTPVYNWIYVKNKSLDFLWKLTSVTISAQVLTIPIIFCAFHQFPTVFLITNILIVPLSSIVLFAELILLATSFIPVVATFTGFVTGKLLVFMNGFIESMNSLPYSVIDGIQNSFFETLLLYIFIISISYWLLNKAKPAFFVAVFAMCAFITIDCVDHYRCRQQEKMIVYNVSQHNAVDFIAGKQFATVGDISALEDNYLEKVNLKPARTLYRTTAASDVDGLYVSLPFVWFCGKKVLLINKPFRFESASKIEVDVIIISNNPRLNIQDIASVFDCKQYIFDGSNSSWKINQWKKDCEQLHLQNYVTADKGAYELNL